MANRKSQLRLPVLRPASELLRQGPHGEVRPEHSVALDRMRGILKVGQLVSDPGGQSRGRLVRQAANNLVKSAQTVIQSAPLKGRIKLLLEQPHLAPRPLIDPIFRVSPERLDAIREEALEVLRAAVHGDNDKLRQLLLDGLHREDFHIQDVVNGFNFLLDAIAGIRRVPAPAGWTGPWPNLGSEEEFLSWVAQQIAYKHGLAASNSDPSCQPDSTRYAMRDAVAFCVAHDDSLAGVPLNTSHLGDEITSLLLIQKTVDQRVTKARAGVPGLKERRVRDRFRFDDSTWSIFFDGKEQIPEADPTAYCIFKAIVQAPKHPVSSSAIWRATGLKGTKIRRELKKLPSKLQNMVRSRKGKRGYWISLDRQICPSSPYRYVFTVSLGVSFVSFHRRGDDPHTPEHRRRGRLPQTIRDRLDSRLTWYGLALAADTSRQAEGS